MRGALLHAVGDDKLDIRDDLALAPVGPADVRVRIRATGVCHSDLHFIEGSYPHPLPAVLGHESAGVVERVLYHMCHALSEGTNVKISGFGSFILRDKGERVGRNPKTGVEVPIAPRRVMTFRASQIMRDRIAK